MKTFKSENSRQNNDWNFEINFYSKSEISQIRISNSCSKSKNTCLELDFDWMSEVHNLYLQNTHRDTKNIQTFSDPREDILEENQRYVYQSQSWHLYLCICFHQLFILWIIGTKHGLYPANMTVVTWKYLHKTMVPSQVWVWLICRPNIMTKLFEIIELHQ